MRGSVITMCNDIIETPVYNRKTMECLTRRDSYLKMCYKDMKQKNPNFDEDEFFFMLFNSNVIDDGGMIESYLKYERLLEQGIIIR